MFGIGRLFLGTSFALFLAATSESGVDPSLYDAIATTSSQNNQHQIRGSAKAKDLPTDTKSVQFAVTFQKFNAGTMRWEDQKRPVPAVVMTTPLADHTASIKTSYSDFTPGQGSKWRIHVSGYYIDNRGKQHEFTPIDSPGFAPRP